MGKALKEVYIAYSKNREVLYVGQGNIGRHKHCMSGCSHNKELNRYYFLNEDYTLFSNYLNWCKMLYQTILVHSI